MKHQYSTYALIGLLAIGAIVSVSAVLWSEIEDFATGCNSLGNNYAVTNIQTTLTCAQFILYNTLNTCGTNEASKWNGTQFECVTITGSGSLSGNNETGYSIHACGGANCEVGFYSMAS